MGRLAFRGGDSQRAVEWAEQARLHAERLAADPALNADGRVEAVTAAAQSHNTLGVACARLGRLEEAVEHIERSVALARGTGLLQAACRGLANLSVLYSTLDPARAIETCAAGLEMAKKIGDLGFRRAFTRISRWPTARSPTAATSRALAPRMPPSISIGASGSSITSRCR